MNPQTFISRIQVKNYRSIADIDIALGPLTVLVGANGSGKSNLVQIIQFVRDIVNKDLDAAVLAQHGIGSIRRWSAKGRPYDIQITLHIKNNHWHGEYSFTLGSEKLGEYRIKYERLYVSEDTPRDDVFYISMQKPLEMEIKDGEITKLVSEKRSANILKDLKRENDLSMSKILRFISYSAPRELYHFLRNMGFYTIYPSNLREPQKPSNPYPLDEKGENLASVLRSLKKNQKETDDTNTIKEALSLVAEGVYDYSVSLVGGFLVTRLQHRHSENGKSNPSFPLAQESDGTLRMLGILTALYQDPPRSLIAIEEPELAIHPGALGVLCDVLKEASQRSQLIITTHNPDLIDKFPEDIILIVEKEQGITKIGPIVESQKDIIRQKLFSPGELMRIQGLIRQQ